MDLALKEFVEKNIHLIEENRFKELYIIAEVDPDLHVYDLTALLHAAEIYPLKELDYNPTVFIVSQRTSSIQHADVILVLDDGKLAGKGTHEELVKNCEVYREIYMSQFKGESKGVSA